MRLPPELTARLTEVATAQERSRTYVVTKILEDYLARTNQQLQSVFE